MLIDKRIITEAEFEAFTHLPENAEKRFELVTGEIIEVPSNPYASQIAVRISSHLFMHVIQHGDFAHVTGEQGGYVINGERYAPDVALVLKAKQASLAREGYNPLPPDLAVEVDYPSTPESQRVMRQEIFNYMISGTVLWLVLSESRTVEVYIPGQSARTLTISDTLDGGELLPGFSLSVKTIFPD